MKTSRFSLHLFCLKVVFVLRTLLSPARIEYSLCGEFPGERKIVTRRKYIAFVLHAVDYGW